MKKVLNPFSISILILAAVLLLSAAVGSVFIPFADLFKTIGLVVTGKNMGSSTLQSYATIIFALRLPRTILIGMTGASLAGSGAAYQGLFRNPLADPYLIGVASGAGLGAVLAMSIKWPYTTIGLLAVPIAAFITAMLTILIVYQLAKVDKTVPTTNLILAGVAVSSLATAITSFMMINASGEIRRSLVWLLGGAAMSGWKPVLAMLPYVIVGVGGLLVTGHSLNVMQFGDEQAAQLGLPVEKVRIFIIIISSLTTAAAVSFAGIIGFVGLMVPHLVRMLWGGDYKKIIPLSIINGASLILVADILARILMAPQELPVGIITALCGAPFFLWILRRSKQQNYW